MRDPKKQLQKVPNDCTVKTFKTRLYVKHRDDAFPIPMPHLQRLFVGGILLEDDQTLGMYVHPNFQDRLEIHEGAMHSQISDYWMGIQ